jgi:hypothetical protein
MEPYDIPHRISYRNIKHPRLELRTGELMVILPFGYDPKILLTKHQNWIIKKTELIKECLRESSSKKITPRTESEFKKLVHLTVEAFAKELKVNVNRVYFRKMKTKWASCSSKKNITVNTLMKTLPDQLINYIIFHEISHLIKKKHTDKFWNLVSTKFPNHLKIEKDLLTYWLLFQSEYLTDQEC